MPESFRLFALSQAMRFAHLPIAGGIYDQHPQLIDEWEILFDIQSQVNKEQEQRQKAKAKRGG